MKTNTKIFLSAVTALLIWPVVSLAQSSGYWYPSGSNLTPVVSTWNLKLPAVANNPCIGTDSSGKLIAGSCTSIATTTGPYFTATSTTATSTFAGGITGPNSFTVQGGTGNVGIGTTNPNTKLEVVGTASSTGLQVNGNGVITGTLNVGNPSGVQAGIALSVIGGVLGTDGTRVGDPTTSNPSPGMAWSFNATGNNNPYGVGIGAVRNSKYDMWFQTGNINGGGYRWYIGTNEKMTMNYQGNVGIGTTNPSQTLDMKAGGTYGYNGQVLAQASTTLHDWFFAGAGNTTLTGQYNTAIGEGDLSANTTGLSNTAIGYNALKANTTGQQNFGLGTNSLILNQGGIGNIGIGVNSLASNVNGSQNLGIGTGALGSETGSYNVAIGASALGNDTGSAYNTAIGYQAGKTLNISGNGLNTFIGIQADVSSAASTTLTNSTAIGYGALVTQSNQIVLGNTNVTQTLLNGNVGIGTTNPNYKLEVNGSASTTQLYATTASIATTTTTGRLNIGADSGSASTTVMMGRFQIDTYDNLGTRYCIELIAGVLTPVAGACNP